MALQHIGIHLLTAKRGPTHWNGEWKKQKGMWCCGTYIYLTSGVIKFQPISGDHGALNIGQYFVGLCDHVGITSHDKSKV